MRKSLLSLFILVFFCSYISRDEKPAYVIFDKNGKRVSFQTMAKTLAAKDLVFFGELHDNPIAHWLELELLKELYKTVKLILGAEMFESDNQAALNLYLHDSIDAKALDTLARLWPNYKNDYQPLVDFAKEKKLPFIATNIPRKYARMVNKKGFESLDSLSAVEKSWIAPLPFPFDPELPGYKKILEMMGDHGTPGIVKAQASKDATMAYFIMKNRKENYLFLHFNGTYHSDDHEGIIWYIKQQEPGINYGTISTVSQAEPSVLEDQYKGKADFIIVVDADMPGTY